jgi:hypothetical protein
MPFRLLATAALILLVVSASPALDKAHYRELQKKAASLARQKDWAGYKRALMEIGRELPGDTPRQMLVMASVEMHLGNKAGALRWMEKYSATGLSYDVSADEDLAELVKDPGFGPVAERMARNRKPVQKSEMVCSLPIPDLMPEDVTYVPAKKSFYASSVQHHSVNRLQLPKEHGAECELSELPLSAEAERWPTLAISWDEHRRVLWVTSSAMPGFEGFPKEESGKAALLAIDPDSGKLLRRLDLASDSPAVLGDMSMARDGTVYMTDSIGGGAYRVAPGPLAKARLEKIADGMLSPQTPVASADGKRLFIADYPLGIAVLDLSHPIPTDVQYLKHPDEIALTGLDGLKLEGDILIGIQNGTDPERIVRFQLNPRQTEITSAEVIEQKTERLGEATHVIKVNGWYYVIANVGWEKVGDNGKLQDGKRFTPPVLLRFPAR